MRVPVWDLPTRVFHWSIVAAIGASWWTGTAGRLEWHRWSGYTILALLVFRLYWGFAGSSTARFAEFVKGPRRVLEYARRLPLRDSEPTLGHNPMAALGALGLLGAMSLQVALGLFAVDVDGLESGPLSHWVSFELGRFAAKAHHWVFDFLLALIALHLAALLFYVLYKRDNLVVAMLRGHREIEGESGAPLRLAPLRRAVPGALLAAAIAWLVASGLRF